MMAGVPPSRPAMPHGVVPDLGALIAGIAAPRRADPAAVRAHLDRLTKPAGSLGRLEDVALRLALIYGDPPPRLTRRVVYVLAADHGVAARGVSAYPTEVTAQMCRNYAAGGAAINAIARTVGAQVVATDIGVAADLSGVEGLVHRNVRFGTRDLGAEAALSRAEVEQAIGVGVGLVSRERIPDVVALGEMGIGNTTAASAVTAALTGAPVSEVVGPGTGVTGAALARKRAAVARALTRLPAAAPPIDVLAEVGGLEIAGLAGVALAAARAGVAIVTDGFVATAAALAAVRLAPPVAGHVFASHRSPEPGHAVLLAALGLEPILDLRMRLGEGTGAALVLPILDAAGGILREMATFEDAGVATRIGEEGRR